ncbi:esterase family protein [Roseomonas populi]|uniref:Esterase family protein n=1 Tax=Roseomonas populi TaxID=3121582 RepID=A0ABT1X039_9PROT|nr:esterase family protein [Roseomonas pecuniae]MCR0981449.1 esterase family protein [Roseomonas pecuniae]
MASEVSPFETLVEDEALRITRSVGNPERRVVSFTGIGLGMGGIQVEEWRQSLAGRTATVTYVTDKRRSWYNDIRQAVLDHFQGLPKADTVTLGNSMGGFGALYFASMIPGCRRAIAFSPQFSVHPDHIPPEEHRWQPYRAAIQVHTVTHALEHARADMEYVALFGGNEWELRHAHRLLGVATPRTQIHVIADSGHGVTQDLKRAGILTALLNVLLSPAPLRAGEVTGLIRSAGLRSKVLR